jgi:hypothetical protein
MFENLIRVNINELKKLDAAYATKDEFTEPDAKKLDMFTCTLSRLMKSLPYIEEYGYDQDHSLSGRRETDPMVRNPGMSGHWPPPPMWSGSYWGGPVPMPEYDPRYRR